MRPEDYWRIEPAYQPAYDEYVGYGREVALRSKVAIVAIARDAMPHLTNTLTLIDDLAGRFREATMYAFENDSTDQTPSILDEFAAMRQWVTVEHDTLQRPDVRGFEPERTIALAEYRNRCRSWVERHAADSNYTIVIDLDPHGGFSPDGVLNSIGWIAKLMGSLCEGVEVGGMASYSLFSRVEEDGRIGVAQYDAWAARLSWWEDRRETTGHMWFHAFLPPVGSRPVRFNSAFGGLAVYRTDAFLAAGVGYAGGDCEHVALHRSMRQAGYGMYLNPGSRYGAILPEREDNLDP